MHSPSPMLLASLLTLSCGAAVPRETVVELTDTVRVSDVSRFGMNIGNDSYYTGAMMKSRVRENFEGTSYRQAYAGPADGLSAEGFLAYAQVGDGRGWRRLIAGADATLLSGPLKGKRVRIRAVGDREAEVYGRRQKLTFFEFESPISLPPGQLTVSSQGILIEKLLLGEGHIGPVGTYWASDNIAPVHGDIPPGAFGTTALLLDGTKPQVKPRAGAKEAFIRFPTHYQRFGQTNGEWALTFWARSDDPDATLSLRTDGAGDSPAVPLTREWRRHDLRLQVSRVPEPTDAASNPHLTFTFAATGARVLLDDVEIRRIGDTNPTAFLDDFVNVLREYNPGIVRRLTMGGSTMRNFLSPPLRAHAFQNNLFADPGTFGSGPERHPFSLGEGLALCEHLGSEAWFCVPGTLHPEEIDLLMEYLSGPTESEGGALRLAEGRSAPWTSTLRRIHIEIGNEAWNTALGFLAGGYNGPDYWEGLFSRAKRSPHWNPRIVLHAAGQNVAAEMSRRILKETPSADRYAIAVYMVHRLDQEDVPRLGTKEDLFRWLNAHTLQTVLARGMPQQAAVSREFSREFSQYEINHHPTGGNAPLDPRNTMVASQGGAVNIANAMLLMLREQGIRSQCFFTLQQIGYDAHGVGRVRLWGANLSQRSGTVRHRPTGLAQILVNKVLGGDLVETRHSGEDPRFEATGRFPAQPPAKGETTVSHPVLWSYGFSDGNRRALVLVNLDTSSARTVRIRGVGTPVRGSAREIVLAADDIAAGNEFDAGEPSVRLDERELTAFGEDAMIVLEPHSLRAIEWRR